MSMGNIESYHQVVPENIVTKVVGKKAIKDYSDKLETLKGVDVENFVGSRHRKVNDSDINEALDDDCCGDIDPESKEWLDFKKAYDNVCDTFEKKTGLRLYALYTDGDGDCYDDLKTNKWYWVIPERDVWVRTTTEKAKAFLKKYGNSAIETDQRHSRFG